MPGGRSFGSLGLDWALPASAPTVIMGRFIPTGPPMLRIQAEALTYDDVSLVPAHSRVLPKDVSLATRLTRELRLNLPIVTAAMDFLGILCLVSAVAITGVG